MSALRRARRLCRVQGQRTEDGEGMIAYLLVMPMLAWSIVAVLILLCVVAA